MDGRTEVRRIVDVLGEIDADIVALQEIFGPGVRGPGQVDRIGSELGLNLAFGRTTEKRGRPYGNAVLSRWPIDWSNSFDLAWTRRDQRGCLRADIDSPFGRIHMFNIHMGTSYFERRHQIRSLVGEELLLNAGEGPRLLVGDFNEWVSGLTTRILRSQFDCIDMRVHVGRRRSYPGLLPFLHLDHIYFEPPLEITQVELVRNRKTLLASDHLPLVAEFAVTATSAAVESAREAESGWSRFSSGFLSA
jgi:endonuclease/exonuclease/phosphatase family metal-dependent hydrolase